MNRVTVFACESQPIVLEGLAKVLGDCEDLEFVGFAASLNDGIEALRELHPDVILVDQTSGLKVVFQFISDVKSTSARCQPVLWVNDLAEVDCFRALQLGARGILKKTLPVRIGSRMPAFGGPGRCVDRKLAVGARHGKSRPAVSSPPDAARKGNCASRLRRAEE